MLLKQTGSKSLPYPVYTLPFVSETHFLLGELYIPRLLPMHGEEPGYEAICRYNSSIPEPVANVYVGTTVLIEMTTFKLQ